MADMRAGVIRRADGLAAARRNGSTRGPVRVRHEPPTLEEAVAAAEGITADRAYQAEIAASLMGVSVAAVQSLMAKTSTRPQRDVRRIGGTLVVERKSRSIARRLT